MWDRFTERSRRAIHRSSDLGRERGDQFISTEHLLLGLLADEGSMAWRLLTSLAISPTEIRRAVVARMGTAPGGVPESVTLTPRAKRSIDLAYHEAIYLANLYIGTEHLLLGLLAEREGCAGRILSELGVRLQEARAAARRLQQLVPEGTKHSADYAALDTFDPGDRSAVAAAVSCRWSLSELHLFLLLALRNRPVAVAQRLERCGLTCDALHSALEMEMIKSGAGDESWTSLPELRDMLQLFDAACQFPDGSMSRALRKLGVVEDLQELFRH